MPTINVTGISAQQAALTSLDGQWQRAIEQYEADLAELQLPNNGGDRYSVKETATRKDAAKAKLVAAADKIKGEATTLRQDVDAAILATNIDPLLQITNTSEREEATYKLPIIADLVDRIPMPELAAQLEAMNKFGSRIERLIYSRHAAQRIDRENKVPTLNYLDNGGNGAIDKGEFVEGLTEARAALAKLVESTDNDMAAKRKAANDAKLEIDRVIMRINFKLHDLFDQRTLAALSF